MKLIFVIILGVFLFSCNKSTENKKPEEDGKTSILWGSSFGVLKNETHADAYKRVKAAFGKHQIARIYCTADPIWPSYIPIETSAQISFKIAPNEVLSGSKDQVLTNFFTSLATSNKIYWTYYHEPEDEIKEGAFTAESFRNAFDYIIALQKKLNKPNLVPTLCLMSYTLDPVSKRNWKDYLPTKVALISWDGYYKDSMGDDVNLIFDDVRQVMAQQNLPWAVAETGVNKMIKQGQLNEAFDFLQRKHWLELLSKDLSTKFPLPVFVLYFDSSPSHDAIYSDWRISDDPTMIAAWNAGQQ